ELRAGSSVHDRAEEGQKTLEGIRIVQRVTGVGDIAQMLLAAEIRKVVTRRVREEERVAGRVHDELGQREPVAIVVGILDLRESSELPRSDPFGDPQVDELLDRR